MTPAELRPIVFARDRGCVWPGCNRAIDWGNPLQLAHLTHRGMGGAPDRNTEANAVALCRTHHDCLDGRTGLGILRTELNGMLRAVVGLAVCTCETYGHCEACQPQREAEWERRGLSG